MRLIYATALSAGRIRKTYGSGIGIGLVVVLAASALKGQTK
jgi:hypothetical protein